MYFKKQSLCGYFNKAVMKKIFSACLWWRLGRKGKGTGLSHDFTPVSPKILPRATLCPQS